MKRLSKFVLSLSLLTSLCACSLFEDVKDDVENGMDKVEDKVEDSTTKKEGKLDDLMLYLKDNGVMFEDETTLDNFNFAAEEGRSFTYDGNKVYVYSVDTTNAAVRTLLQQATDTNRSTANQDGKNLEYGASANDKYLLVYDLHAKVDKLLDNFKNYKYEKENSAAR